MPTGSSPTAYWPSIGWIFSADQGLEQKLPPGVAQPRLLTQDEINKILKITDGVSIALCETAVPASHRGNVTLWLGYTGDNFITYDVYYQDLVRGTVPDEGFPDYQYYPAVLFLRGLSYIWMDSRGGPGFR